MTSDSGNIHPCSAPGPLIISPYVWWKLRMMTNSWLTKAGWLRMVTVFSEVKQKFYSCIYYFMEVPKGQDENNVVLGVQLTYTFVYSAFEKKYPSTLITLFNYLIYIHTYALTNLVGKGNLERPPNSISTNIAFILR